MPKKADKFSEDRLADDLREILDKAGVKDILIQYDQLMQLLSIYIVNRDHKIFDHAYKLGKEADE